MKNDQWIQYENNSHIEHQLNTEKFRCRSCNKNLKGKTAAARHSTAIHQLTINGNQLPKQSLTEIKPKLDSDTDIIDEIREPENLEKMVLNLVTADINRDIARGATRLAQNIDLRFLYANTKYMFPPEWDFESWISALVTFALASFGVKVTVSQNKDVLSKEQLKFSDMVKADWVQYLTKPT